MVVILLKVVATLLIAYFVGKDFWNECRNPRSLSYSLFIGYLMGLTVTLSVMLIWDII